MPCSQRRCPMSNFLQVKKAVGNKATLEQIWDSTLYHLHDLPFAEDLNDMQDVFTPFKNKVKCIG